MSDEQKTWPPAWLKGLAPTDPLMAMAWRDCLHWASGDHDIVAIFQKDTGETYTPPRNGIEAMIDQAAGVKQQLAIKFVRWFNANIWA